LVPSRTCSPSLSCWSHGCCEETRLATFLLAPFPPSLPEISCLAPKKLFFVVSVGYSS
jgi:hypothetical protein